MEGLRALRRSLEQEHREVSHWQRVLQTRLEQLSGTTPGEDVMPVEQLRRMLTRRPPGARRAALHQALPALALPELPPLPASWEQPAPDHPAGRAALRSDLAHSEQGWARYQGELRARLGSVTAELIARYRAAPRSALSALPRPGRAPNPPRG